MTKNKSTKRALLMSALSLLMCVSMLIGSTFAWFTDSVTSAGNTIQSGTLDVDLVDAYGKSLEGEVIEFVTTDKRAQDKILWEPGCTYETEPVYVVNKGDLALKYEIVINGINGDAKLLEAIEWTVTIDGKETDLSAFVGNLIPGKTEKSGAIVLSGHMKEEAGNEYQDLSAEGISIAVFATQFTSESDSFNNTYDGAATFLNKDEAGNWLINNAGDLLYLAKSVNSGHAYKGETIKLTADIDLGGRSWTPIGNSATSFAGIFDGQKHTVSNFKVDVAKNAGLFGVADGRGGNGAINNLTVKNATIKAGDYAGAIVGSGYNHMNNCHAVDCEITVTPFLMDDGVTYDGGAKAGGIMGRMWEAGAWKITNCTVTNVEIAGYRDLGGLIGMTYDSNVVENCTVSDSKIAYIYLKDGQKYADNTPNENMDKIVGRPRTATLNNNVANNVALVKTLATTNEELDNAIKNGEKYIVLAANTKVTIPSGAANSKDVTISGDKSSTVVLVNTNPGYEGKLSYQDNANLTFKGITFDANQITGICARGGNVVFEDCFITGELEQTIASSFKFIGCTFDVGVTQVGYGCNDVVFEDCTFKTDGYGIKIYIDNKSASLNLTVKGCSFKNTGSAERSAILLDHIIDGISYNITVEGCTFEGYTATPTATYNKWAERMIVAESFVKTADGQYIFSYQTGAEGGSYYKLLTSDKLVVTVK